MDKKPAGREEELDARLERVTAYRRTEPSGEHPETRAVLELTAGELKSGDTDRQGIYWYGRRWAEAKGWCDKTRRRLISLAAALEPSDADGRLIICRSDVFDRRDDPMDLFLAAMAWGFGTTGYGQWRTAAMVNPAGRDREAVVKAAVAAYRAAWRDGGAKAVAEAWDRGAGKIPGLGPAFASKVAYFAAYDRGAKTGPLIADLNTAWAVWALGGIWDSRYDSGKYADYVTWCERWAAQLGCRSDDIERVLFGLGPKVRKINKELAADP